MTFDDELRRALERLRAHHPAMIEHHAVAALIEAIQEIYVDDCNCTQCAAFVALVRAVNGGKP